MHIVCFKLSASYFDLHKYFLHNLYLFLSPLCVHQFHAAIFCSSWDESPTNFWTLPVFSDFLNMALNDLVQPIAAAVISLVKLCPYDEEEPHIWFHLIEAQFAAAGIRLQNSNMPMLSPTCPSKSSGTFWTPWMSATIQIILSIF
jgi:hypothetical protein